VSLTVLSLLCDDVSRDPPMELMELAVDARRGIYLEEDGL
jgi:hypothetical protein